MASKIVKENLLNGLRVTIYEEDNHTQISECKISLNGDGSIWSISEWFTNSMYQHKGYGLKVLSEALVTLYNERGMPDEIRYNWNGANQYVYDWMARHFNPRSLVPEYEQGDADKKTYHIYILDKVKVISYVAYRYGKS